MSDVRERRDAGRLPTDLQRDRQADRALADQRLDRVHRGRVYPGGLGILRIHINGEGLRLLAELTLAMVLFTDAANADFSIVERNLGLPERLLGIGLPLTIVLGFLGAAIVFPRFEILEMALLAAILAPTDAALGKPVVTNPAMPAAMREALNLESESPGGSPTAPYVAVRPVADDTAYGRRCPKADHERMWSAKGDYAGLPSAQLT